MRYPANLPEGGTIGFVAPSFGCATEPYASAFRNALRHFVQLGYKTVLGPNVFAGDGIGISSSPESCGRELTEGYLSKESDILISCGGGELMCEDLDFVDFEAIRKADPKWYMGYSDNTNFTFLLTTLCDTASIYGPCAPAFGMEPWHSALQDALEVLRGEKHRLTGYEGYETEGTKDEEHPLEPYHIDTERVIRSWVPGGETDAGSDRLIGAGPDREIHMKGRLLGGCLDILVNLAGTNFDRTADFAERYREDGIIWFLESCDLTVFSMRRALWELKHAGWFSHVKGFLIGRPLHHGEVMMGLDQYRAVTDMLESFGVPVVMDLDIGHIPPMMPLVCGSMAEVNVKGQEFSLEMTYR